MYWYKKVLNQYADFEGRARRQEYWTFALVNIIILLPLYFIGIGGEATGNNTLMMIGFGLYLLYALAVLLPSIAVAVRRLHDVGKSGWMYLLILIPIIGALYLLYLFVTEGDKGDNQYGPDPKANV